MSDLGVLRWLLTASALATAIVALVLTNVWTQEHNNNLANTRDALAALSANDTTSAMQISMLQSEMVEILMHVANETGVSNGTFVWSFSSGTDYPADSCSGAPLSYTMQSAGTGYRVGDLITLPHAYLTVTYQVSPIFRVDSVGGAGEVVNFTTLSRGCNAGGPQGTAVPGNSIVGTGFTVTRDTANSVGVTDDFYLFPTPPKNLVAPLQVGRYSLKELTISSVTFTVLVIEPPEFPMVSGYDGIGSVVSAPYLKVTQFGWTPDPPILLSLSSGFWLVPFTRKNLAAMSLVDDTGCWTGAQTSVQCFIDAEDDSTPYYYNSGEFGSDYEGSQSQIPAVFFTWFFNTLNWNWDLLANHANFTLTNSLMLVLPSL